MSGWMNFATDHIVNYENLIAMTMLAVDLFATLSWGLAFYGGPYLVGEQQNHSFKLSFNRSSKVDLQGSHAAWRTLVTLLVISGVAVGVLSALNIAGWRARVLARLFRTESRPLMVAPPASFRPEVPLGFKVSAFARGFAQPRWREVAPDRDVFVADSAAGEIIVLHAVAGQLVAKSREVFADT